MRILILVILSLALSSAALPQVDASGPCTVITPDGGSPTTSFFLDVVTTADWVIDSPDCATLYRPSWDLDHNPIWVEEGAFSVWTDGAGQLHMSASHDWGQLSQGVHDIIGTYIGCGNPSCANEWEVTVTNDPTALPGSLNLVQVGPERFTADYQTPPGVTVPYESVGPVQAGPYTQPLPVLDLLRYDITIDNTGFVTSPSDGSTVTVPPIDIQDLTGEPIPLSVCEAPTTCSHDVPGVPVTPFGGGGSVGVYVLTMGDTLTLP